jgi:hypothetical protein
MATCGCSGNAIEPNAPRALMGQARRSADAARGLLVVTPQNVLQPHGLALVYAPPFPYRTATRIGRGSIVNPLEVAISPGGSNGGAAFIADESSRTIVAFAPPFDGEPIVTIDNDEPYARRLIPGHLIFNPNGDLIATWYAERALTWTLTEYSPPYTGRIALPIPPNGAYPDLLIVDRYGNLIAGSELFGSVYVAMPPYHKWHLITYVQWLRGIATSAAGHLFIEDGVKDQILEYARTGSGTYGRLLARIHIAQAVASFSCTNESAPNEHGNTLAVDANENVFVAERFANRNAVAEYGPPAAGKTTPAPLRVIPVKFNANPLAIALDGAGNLYVSSDAYPPHDPGLMEYSSSTGYKVARVLSAPKCAASLAFY